VLEGGGLETATINPYMREEYCASDTPKVGRDYIYKGGIRPTAAYIKMCRAPSE